MSFGESGVMPALPKTNCSVILHVSDKVELRVTEIFRSIGQLQALV